MLGNGLNMLGQGFNYAGNAFGAFMNEDAPAFGKFIKT
jgi:hypothetical protein